MFYRFFCTFIISLLLSLPAYSSEDLSQTPTEDKTLFMGIIIKNYDKLVEPFLKSIEKLDYDKKQIAIQIDFYGNSPTVKKQVKKWTEKNKEKYRNISYPHEESNETLNCSLVNYHPLKKYKFFGEIRNQYLKKTKDLNCDYCFIVDSDTFLSPITLKNLISREKAIITPVLRPVPDSNDNFCNFLNTTNDEGFFNFDSNFFENSNISGFYPNYSGIIDRTHRGMWAISAAFGAYLIQSQYVDKLTFIDSVCSEDFFALARSVKNNNLKHYICNEKEFGSFIHFTKPLTLNEEREFSLIGDNIEINSDYLKKILSHHYINDADLKKYVESFPFDEYDFYRVENRDLFYLDNKFDFIKSLYLKKGKVWERHVQEVLKEYTKPGSVAVDIGGHIGTHTLTLSKQVGEKGVVHVFEPQVKLFPELVINMNINGCQNISFHRTALGNKKMLTTLVPPDAENEGAYYIKPSSQLGQSIFVETLDSFQLNNVSIMKIDVENFEIEVLEGAKETILRNKPAIVIEIFPDHQAAKELIINLGYEMVPLGNEDFLFLPKKPK